MLWAEKTDEHKEEISHPVSYWLESIHDLSEDSPIILIKNQIDRSDQLPIEPSELCPDVAGYEQIRQSIKISALRYQGIHSLRGAIQDIINELSYRIFVDMPTSWITVQDELKQRHSQKSISFANFQQLCIKVGISDIDTLINYLHKTGIVFYKKGAFLDRVILDQNWVVNAVYRLYNPEKYRNVIECMQGSFTGKEASIFWPDVDATEHEVYLDFMRSCGICYEPDYRYHNPKPFINRKFILPALLPQNNAIKAAWGEPRKDDWKLKISYPFLHRSIIELLIMKLGEQFQSTPWRHGIFCKDKHGQLLLKCEYSDKKSNHGYLNFHLRYAESSILLSMLRRLVFQVSPHPRYKEWLSISGKSEIELRPYSEEKDFLDNQDISNMILSKNRLMHKTVKLFISYSHADEAYKNELEICLKGIRRRIPTLEYWDDRQIFAGQSVDGQILSMLQTADIAALLISRNFFSSDYCFSIEMEKALKQFEEGNNIVIPIIIRETADWHSFDIGKIAVLPTDGKPLDDWQHPDKFWADVQIGISN